MELPTEISVVMKNAAQYFMGNGASIPAYQQNRIVELMGPGISPVDFTVKVAELLYAVADNLDDRGREIAAQVANLAALNGWHGMTARGNKMVGALKKMNGEESSQPYDEDPEPLAEYTGEPAPEPARPPSPVPPGPLVLEDEFVAPTPPDPEPAPPETDRDGDEPLNRKE